jgi:NAD(P)-dependent dehydrogenase (short-subunit alcohol dehydrogenase family)
MATETTSPGVLERFRLTGRRALVTGGGQGLGRVIAQALAEAGADVAVASRSLETCRQAAAEIAEATGRRAEAYAVDVTQASGVTRLVQDVEAGLGPLDILVNNAGINIRGASDELAEADWDAVLDTNLKATFLLSRVVGPGMCARGFGRIINMGSILSVVALPGRAAYASSKAGVRGEDPHGPLGGGPRDRGRRGVPGLGSLVVRDRILAVRGRRLDRPVAVPI